ncbi:MAG TPA: S9 family peptidase [Thermoanaerobaculia bacterium]|nr:S9 family peptidase [Thermoanaerobaculia bacterium]
MKRRSLFITLVFIAATALAAKQPVTHETLWLMKRVGTPAISPDGRWVAFSVTDPSYDPKEQSSDLWLAPADGSAKPRKITSSKATEGDLTWSPDSRRIAFTTKREGDEASQLYLLDIAGGGEAQRITSQPAAVSSPKFSDDGHNILFVSSVKRSDEKDRKANVRVYESYPIRNWDRWIEPDKQVHLFVQPLAEGSKATDVLAGTKLIAVPGFAGTSAGLGGETIHAEWSPDGQWIVFGVSTDRNTAAYAETGVDLYRVRATGGEPERIAHGEGSYGDAQFSPDGKTLYATFNPNNKLPFNNNRLVGFDWPSMANRREIVGQPFDRSVGDYAVTSDGKTIYFTAGDAGLEKIYVVSSKGGDARLAVEPERGVYTDLAIAGNSPSLVMIGRWGSSIDPQEIVRIDPAAKTRRNITDFNVEKAASLDWQPPQHFWFTNKDGMRIHNMIVVPENFDPNKKYPLFVLIHGGAASMWADQISLRWNYHLLAKPGYVMLMTDYRGSTGYGEKFAQSIQGDPLRGPGNDVNQAADEAIKRFPFIDGTRQIAGGASYGGHLANWLEATTTRYKAIISHAGLSTLLTQWGTSDGNYSRELMVGGPFWDPKNKLWIEQSPLTYAANFKTPILMSVGERDFRVPMNNTLEMWATLQRERVPSKLLVWPEENHWILNGENSKFFYETVWDWIARWVNT